MELLRVGGVFTCKMICSINVTSVFFVCKCQVVIISLTGAGKRLAGEDFAIGQMTNGLGTKYKSILQVNHVIIFGA